MSAQAHHLDERELIGRARRCDDSGEIVETVHARRAPMTPVSRAGALLDWTSRAAHGEG